jgi:hypothetical protein
VRALTQLVLRESERIEIIMLTEDKEEITVNQVVEWRARDSGIIIRQRFRLTVLRSLK